jgi:precorrin-2 dehydrogenase
MPGYPAELNLTGQTALVVGLGAVGRRKVAGLLDAGARVLGVDPSWCPLELRGEIEFRAEPYHATHLHGVALAVAAAPPRVNRRVVSDARLLGVWVNSVSNPASGTFTVPAIRRDGLVTLTVSTSGASPALAVALRDRAADALGPAASGLANIFAELRPIVIKRLASRRARRELLIDWADPRWLELWEHEGPERVRYELLKIIDEQSP